MLFKERKEFTFVSKALAEDAFSVVKFRGAEAISKPYEFDITLASEDPEIDLTAVLQNPATLTIVHGDEEMPFHGVLSRFEQLHEVKQHVFYRAVLVPKLWNAGLYHENQVFLDKKVPEIIEEVLKQTGMSGMDYELNLTREYPKWEYICQYGETCLDFISRWMERDGIFYFFEQTEQGAKMVLSDNLSIHKDITGESKVPYSPPSGLIASEAEIVRDFVCRQKMLPAKVILKDYNYRNPGLEVKGEAEVDPDGRGEVYVYGEHFKNPDEGTVLAKIRAEELLCRKREFLGEATAPAFSPGFIFELTGHYRSEYSRKYLITEIGHEGSRSEDLLAGLGEKRSELEEKPGYANRFVCIPSDVQFRPERKTSKPKFYGTMNAKVDAAGDGKYAELDGQGRYKVILPFDLSGRSDGKASRFIRMAQPYSGFAAADGIKGPSGMHFPLHKGAEVLLTFVDGDPDRPIISSALPNPETVSPVTNENQTKSVIRDNYGNELIFDSTPGSEHISLYSPHHRSGIHLGKSAFWESKSECGGIFAGLTTEVHGGGKSETIMGSKSEMLIGFDSTYKLSFDIEAALSSSVKIRCGPDYEISFANKIHQTEKDMLQIAEGDVIIESECTKTKEIPLGDKIKGLLGKKELKKIYEDSKLFLTAGRKRESIVEMSQECLRLSVGKGEKRKTFNHRENTEFTIQTLVGSAAAMHALNAGAAIGTYIALKPDETSDKGANLIQSCVSGGTHALTVFLSTMANIIALDMYRHDVKPDEVKTEIEQSGKNSNASFELKNNGEASVTGKENITISSESKNVKLDATNGEIQVISKALKGKGPVELGNGALKIMAPPPSPKKPGKPFGGVDALTGMKELSPASKEMAKKLKRI